MSSRKSCINLEPAKPGSFFHISREVKPDYLLDSIKRNSCDKNAMEAQAQYDKLLSKAIDCYMKRTKQRLQLSPKKLLWEAVIVLEEHHTLKDVEKLSDYLAKKYGWQSIQIGLHRDEGYVDDVMGEFVYNYHAHIVFLMIDKRGIYVFKKREFGKKAMSILQTEVAEIMGMTRGISKLKSRRERLSAKQYRSVEKEKCDLQFKLDRMTDDAAMFEDVMLQEHDMRIKAENDNKELQQIVLALQENKKKENIAIDTEKKQPSDEETSSVKDIVHIPSRL